MCSACVIVSFGFSALCLSSCHCVKILRVCWHVVSRISALSKPGTSEKHMCMWAKRRHNDMLLNITVPAFLLEHMISKNQMHSPLRKQPVLLLYSHWRYGFSSHARNSTIHWCHAWSMDFIVQYSSVSSLQQAKLVTPLEGLVFQISCVWVRNWFPIVLQ